MTTPTLSETDLAALAAFDTPTICNALELVAPERRGHGYTTSAAQCGFPAMKPVVGFARTVRIRAQRPSELPRPRCARRVTSTTASIAGPSRRS